MEIVRVISTPGSDNFANALKEALEEGYYLVGGVSTVLTTKGQVLYTQICVKDIGE